MSMTNEPTQYTNAELARKVIGAVDAIQDAHVTVIDGARKLTTLEAQIVTTPAPDMLPRAGSTGKLDAGWLPGSQCYFAVCATSASAAAKTVTLSGFVLSPGAVINLIFNNVNTATSPTLSVNGSDAKPILYHGIAPEVGQLAKGWAYTLLYTGSAWQIMGGLAPWGICQTVWFEDTLSRPGFAPLNGGRIDNFAATWPQAAAYLATTHGKERCFTGISDYNAAHVAAWHTLAGGGTVNWDGFGGVCKFYYNKPGDYLLLPDLRGMFRAMAGDGVVAPSLGGVMGDRARKVIGAFTMGGTPAILSHYTSGGCFTAGASGWAAMPVSATSNPAKSVALDTSLNSPTGATNAPRSWGALACAYLGQSAV